MKKVIKNIIDWSEIGVRFKQFRKSLDLSQEKMGKLANQTCSSISQFELGSTPAST
ncbi:helix-turn-helix transcriptional regulator [Candidatus Liberibacter brunswickensis]|uniref:helix-turn-helix transcriptional regulator n=1 Tax=Candidatus Liberibacter brunswickensis TaxID=1968796 RepID=UPI002FE165E0